MVCATALDLLHEYSAVHNAPKLVTDKLQAPKVDSTPTDALRLSTPMHHSPRSC